MNEEIIKLLVSPRYDLGLKKLKESGDYYSLLEALREAVQIDSVVMSDTQGDDDFGSPRHSVKIKNTSEAKFDVIGHCLRISIETDTAVLQASEFLFDNNMKIGGSIKFDYGKTYFEYSIKESFIKAHQFDTKELEATGIIQANSDDEDLQYLVYGKFDEQFFQERWGKEKLVDYSDDIRYTRGIKTVDDILKHLTDEQKTPTKFYLEGSERYNHQEHFFPGDPRECISSSTSNSFDLRYKFRTVLGTFYIEVGRFTKQEKRR